MLHSLHCQHPVTVNLCCHRVPALESSIVHTCATPLSHATDKINSKNKKNKVKLYLVLWIKYRLNSNLYYSESETG